MTLFTTVREIYAEAMRLRRELLKRYPAPAHEG